MTSDAAFGIGAYTLPEAARLIGGLSSSTLRHWVAGYGYERDGARTEQPPLWRAQYEPTSDTKPLIGFRDLIEARTVRALRTKGIGLPTIRLCLDRAREIVDDDHPFSSSQFKTDGHDIFLRITKDLEEPALINLKRRQHVFNRIVEPSFIDLEFDDEAAIRWWLLPKKRSILIDPTIAFGQPTVAGHNMTTRVLTTAVEAEGSIARVAKLYEIDRKLVSDAVLYEKTRGPTG